MQRGQLWRFCLPSIPDIEIALDGCLLFLLLLFAGVLLYLLNFAKIVVATFALDFLEFCEVGILPLSMNFKFSKLLTKQGKCAIKLMILFRLCFMLFMLFMMLVLFLFRHILFWFLPIDLLFKDCKKFGIFWIEVLNRSDDTFLF